MIRSFKKRLLPCMTQARSTRKSPAGVCLHTVGRRGVREWIVSGMVGDGALVILDSYRCTHVSDDATAR